MSAGLLALILWDFEGWPLLANLDIALLVPAVAYSIAANSVLGAWHWRFVMRRCGIDATFMEVLRLWNGLQALTFFAPLQSGHALYALALKRTQPISWPRAIECAAYTKYSHLVATFTLVAIGQTVLAPDHPWAGDLVSFVAIAVVIVFFADGLALRLLPARLSWLASHPIGVRDKVVLLGVSVVYQASELVAIAAAIMAVGLPWETLAIVGVYPMILLASYVPLTFSGFGLRENLTAEAMGDLLGQDPAIAASLVVDFAEYVLPALVGVAFVRHTLLLMGGADGLAPDDAR